jgi:hypothetical protein
MYCTNCCCCVQEPVDWKGAVLGESQAAVQRCLDSNSMKTKPAAPSIDIVVPSFKALNSLSNLKAICDLVKDSPNQSSQVIIICDYPAYTDELQRVLEKLPRVRVRGNKVKPILV